MKNTPDSLDHGRFPLGNRFVTRTADKVLAPEDIVAALHRHVAGDWGDVSAGDRAMNERSLKEGLRLHSKYHDHYGVEFWILTEWDRSRTTVLLPIEYQQTKLP